MTSPHPTPAEGTPIATPLTDNAVEVGGLMPTHRHALKHMTLKARSLETRLITTQSRLKEAERVALNLHAVLMGAHGLITMCREHFLERELKACDGNPLYAPECLTAIKKINAVDKEFVECRAHLARHQTSGGSRL